MSAPGTSQPPVPVPSGDGGGDRELSHPPRDGVSNLCFSRHSNRLLASSWDKSVRFFDVEANQMIAVFSHKRPVLDCCFHDDQSGFSACSDCVVRRLSLDSKKSFRLGIHDAPVSCLEYSCVAGQVISGSWDNTIKCWDPKSGPGQALVGTHNQPERVYSLSIQGYKLVVATAGRHVNVYDLRNMSEPEQQRESPLQYQTRFVECYPNGTGFALGSVEGKIAMEFFDQSESALSKSYVFKCHRLTEDGRRVAYPVNTSTFHPVFGTFATGGCDGFVNVWDGRRQKRLIQYPRYPTSIAALSFNRDGSLLAIASSYTYESGERPHEPDTIFIRDVNDVEIRPRPRANTIPALPQ